MANYTNIPNTLFEALRDGRITNKMFIVMGWLLRRANFKNGEVKWVSASQIQSEMWPDELEDRARPCLRTIQRVLNLLARCGYIKSLHVQGNRRNYKVIIHNYVAYIGGEELTLNPCDTVDYHEVLDSADADRDGESSGDPSRDVSVSRPVTGTVSRTLPQQTDSSLSPPLPPDSPDYSLDCLSTQATAGTKAEAGFRSDRSGRQTDSDLAVGQRTGEAERVLEPEPQGSTCRSAPAGSGGNQPCDLPSPNSAQPPPELGYDEWDAAYLISIFMGLLKLNPNARGPEKYRTHYSKDIHLLLQTFSMPALRAVILCSQRKGPRKPWLPSIGL